MSFGIFCSFFGIKDHGLSMDWWFLWMEQKVFCDENALPSVYLLPVLVYHVIFLTVQVSRIIETETETKLKLSGVSNCGWGFCCPQSGLWIYGLYLVSV